MKPTASDYLNHLFANGAARANYLVHWSPARRYIYVETPKVACTTIKRVLQADALDGGEPNANVHDRVASPIPRVSDDVEGFRALNESSDCFRFCFVRNPFTRALSCYLDKFVQNAWERRRLSPLLGFDPKEPPSFLEFLSAVEQQPEENRDIHWSSQTYLLRPNRFKYSFIGRFEFFSDQFLGVCEFLQISGEEHVNSIAHATGAATRKKEFFGKDEQGLIRKIYSDDFRNFGYGRSIDVI